MFSCLRPVSIRPGLLGCVVFLHLSISCRDDNDSTIHTGSTSDHVLDIIGVTRTVNVGIMSVRGLVFDMCGRDGDTTFSFFGSFVDSAIFEEFCQTFFCLSFGDGGS